MSRVPRLLFRWLGRRYPGFLLTVQFQVAHIVALGGVGLLTLYERMSVGEFFLVLGVVEGVTLVENVFSTVLARKMLRPVRRWLKGARGPESTLVAWHALVELPVGFLRRWKVVPIAITLPVITTYIALELGLNGESAAILFLGGLVVISYGATLRFFAMEIALRPVLESVARELPEESRLEPVGVPLRVKLLAALPMINLITGVVAAGLSSGGTSELSDLGLDVLIAIGVAATISLELTLLLSRSILAPIHDLRDATELVRRGDYSARVPVVSGDETGRLAQSFNRMASGLEERERLREAFGAFVDPDVADRVLREGTLEGDELEVSVLFLDIRDFTAYAEQASAREVVARLNDFYGRVVPVLSRHGGHANKFIGDGLLAVFGAPERGEDHADRALAAALEIRELVRDCYGDELRIGMGLNSGPVMAGTVGGGGRLDFTVIGDPVNTAARVEEATRRTGDDLLVTQATRALLERGRESCSFEERPPTALRGKTEEVRLFAPVPKASAERTDGRPSGTGQADHPARSPLGASR